MRMRSVLAGMGVPAVAALGLGYMAIASPGARPSPQQQQAEGFQWFWVMDGPAGSDAGSEIVSDDEGNIFVAGATSGLDLDRDGTLDLVVDGADVLFFKLRETPETGGVEVEWIRSPVSPGFNTGQRIAVDRRGGAYGIGRFQQYVEFGRPVTLPGEQEAEPGRQLTLQGRGLNDGFIVRYDPDGEVLWARTIGGPGQDAPMDVASDAAGNAYVVGWGEGTFELDDRGMEFRGGTELTGLIVSYDPEGNARWVHAVPAPNRILFGVEVSPDGEVYVTGELEAAIDLDGDGRIDLPASRDRDGFVARYDVNGTLLGAWATPSPGSLAFLDGGDVLLGGGLGGQMDERYGPADFDGDGRADIEPKGGPMGSWVARYDREGRLRWVRSYAMDMPGDLESDGERVVMSGGYNGIRDLDEDGVPERVDHRSEQERFNTEMAILVLSGEDGRPERAWTAPGPGKDHAASALFMPDRRTLYVTGSLQYTADFTGDGVNGEGWVECESLGDLFFAQYRLPEPGALVATREISADCGCPKEGRWDALNLEGKMECEGAVNVSKKLGEVRDKGVIFVMEEDCSSLFGDSQTKKEEDVLMTRVEGCTYEGTMQDTHDGITMVIDVLWTIEGQEFIRGEMSSSTNMGPMTCDYFRPYELTFVEELSEDDYQKWREIVQEKVEKLK